MADNDTAVTHTTTSRAESFLLGAIADQRRHRRIFLSLPVRFMVSEEGEHRGVVFDMSPGGLSVTSDLRPAIGGRAVLYIDDIGRVEGMVARHHTYGFAVRLSTTQNRRDKIAERLIYHANRHRLRGEDLRVHERYETDGKAHCIMPDGTEVACQVIDLSLTGAAIGLKLQPPVGSEVSIGRMRGRIVRHIPGGVAIRFLKSAASAASLAAHLNLR